MSETVVKEREERLLGERGKLRPERIRLFRDGDEEGWNRFVAESPNANAYHVLGWKRVIEDSFGHKTHYLLSEDDRKNINGVLPLVELKSLLFGHFLASLPFFNYAGVCAKEPEIRRGLLREAVRVAHDAGAAHIELRETRPIEAGWPVKEAKVLMKLDLPSSSEALWDSFSSKLRSQIRRPQKEGMSVRFGRREELEAFYRVFSINMRDLGTPVYSKDFFARILEEFPESASICTVYQGPLPVASGFLIGYHETLQIPWASSLKSHNRYGPNMLLYWSVLKRACDQGLGIFDFGRSTPGEGVYKFKEQWGAKPAPLYWYYWMEREGKIPELNPKNPKYALAIHLWKKLPVGLTRIIGPAIVKYLP